VRQFRQQILPPGMPATTVWGYGSAPHRGTFNYPAFTIEARADRPVRVTWINELVDRNGRYLPHLLPVGPTLHWANPPGGTAGRDMRPRFASTPGPYTGPVPIVTHLHGSHSAEESDGFAEAWYLPHASNIPAGYAGVGSFYNEFRAKFQAKWHQAWPPGTAVFQYQNDQRASTLWFHDHTLGMTRLNVYAGPAGFYLLRGGPDVVPTTCRPACSQDRPEAGRPAGTRYYETPIAVQDRSFNADGSLFYPASRKFFDGFGGPYIPDEPFGGGKPGQDFQAADPATLTPLGPATTTRRVSLNEEDSAVLEGVGPRAALLGTLDASGHPVHLGTATSSSTRTTR
jgi:spore coat protein A, manganese oxidase